MLISDSTVRFRVMIRLVADGNCSPQSIAKDERLSLASVKRALRYYEDSGLIHRVQSTAKGVHRYVWDTDAVEVAAAQLIARLVQQDSKLKIARAGLEQALNAFPVTCYVERANIRGTLNKLDQ